MHKLTSLEAQRVTSVLDETVDRLSTLSFIPLAPPPSTSNELLESLQEVDCGQVKSCLTALWQLEESHRATKENASYKSFGGEECGFELTEQLHQTARTLCRLLRTHPIAMDLITSHQRSSEIETSSQFLQDLAAITFRRLSTTVEEEAANSKTLRELTEKEKLSEKDREGLQQNLEFQRAEKDREVALLGQLISKLRSELHDITRTNEIEIANIEQGAKENVESAKTMHDKTVDELKTETDRLTGEITKLFSDNQVAEAAMRKKKTKLETDLTHKIKQYDTEMGALQNLIDELNGKYSEESSELAILQAHFDKVDANSATSKAEKELIRQIEALDQEAEDMLGKSAAQIQKRARGMVDRVVVAKLMKKSKKGKKGKKGKK